MCFIQRISFIFILSVTAGCALLQKHSSWHFITRDADKLMDGGDVFRFVGFYAPELHRIENSSRGACKKDPTGRAQFFKWPSALEQENWIKALTLTGHSAVRVHALSVATPYDGKCQREAHILPAKFNGGVPQVNEAAMQYYDRMIALADQHRLRLILPFINHWQDWGGREQLSAFYGEHSDALYDIRSKTFAAYLHIIKQVILRKNTITGRLYRDEPAIMAWETGNELIGSNELFIKRTAAFIKLLDNNHLVVDGTHRQINEFSLTDPNVDIISVHHYSKLNKNESDRVVQNLEKIKSTKVYFAGVFGAWKLSEFDALVQSIVGTEYKGSHIAGAYISSFRGRREDGGFYWHKDDHGHYSIHLPGFEENEHNHELAVIKIVREAQAEMQGLESVSPLPKPQAPILHAPENPSRGLFWMGPPLAESYRIERAKSAAGPWEVIAESVYDGYNEFDPERDTLFIDEQAMNLGSTFFYRVVAINESGESKASNSVRMAYKVQGDK